MGKKKTSKSASKRFKLSARGKVMFHRSGASHLLIVKSSKRKRALKKKIALNSAEQARIADLLR